MRVWFLAADCRLLTVIRGPQSADHLSVPGHQAISALAWPLDISALQPYNPAMTDSSSGRTGDAAAAGNPVSAERYSGSWLAVSALVILILTAACSEKPSMRFYPTWSKSEALLEVWPRAGTSLQYELLGENGAGYGASLPYGVRVKYSLSDFKEFTVIVRGRLPMDEVHVQAIYISDSGVQQRANVVPMLISRGSWVDPRVITWDDVWKETNLSAFRITVLNPNGSYNKVALPTVLPGRYYVSLVCGGKKLCGSDLTIRQ